MTLDLLFALVSFAFVTSITPGPNNLMLMASGANFGMARTVPHLLGVAGGFVIMAVVLGAGLSQAYEKIPVLQTLLKGASILFMLWLAWKLFNAAAPQSDGKARTPLTFLQAAAFQWANPKAWAMAITALTAYSPDTTIVSVATVALVFGAVNLPSVLCWAMLGTQLRRLLATQTQLRIFNTVMAALLLLSLYPILRS